MLGRGDRLFFQRLAFAHLRQTAGLVVFVWIVAIFVIDPQKSIELDHRSGRPQVEQAGADLGRDIGGGPFDIGGLHLARDRAHPDELIKLGLLGLEMAGDVARPTRDVGRANSLVRFLRVLGLGLITPRGFRHVALAVVSADDLAERGQRVLGDLHAVGAHVGDQPDRLAADIHAFVKALSDPHRVGGGKAELAAGFLLQGGGRERWIGIPLGRFGFNGGNREGCRLQRLLERLGLRARSDVEALDLLAISPDEACLERIAARSRKRSDERPELPGNEFLDLELAIAHKPERDRLDASSRPGSGELAPENRRQGKPDEVVERPARQIGIDQGMVDVARVRHRLSHRLFGDGVENHALDLLVFERLLLLQHLEDVP